MKRTYLRTSIWQNMGPMIASLCLITLLGIACGGNTGPGPNLNSSNDPVYTPGVYGLPSDFEDRCASPRTGIDPATNKAYPDKVGSAVWENFWLRSWTNAYYLWYSEVPDIDPASKSTSDYFALMKTTQASPTGHPKDRFHFTYPTSEWYQLSQGGVSVSYGVAWALIATRPPRKLQIAYIEPKAPATTLAANLQRGATIVAIDGVDFVNAADQQSVDKLNAGLFPSAVGESHTFSVRDTPSSTVRTVTLTAAVVETTNVQYVKTFTSGTAKVGYMLFTDHLAKAEAQLIDAFTTLSNAGVSDLILDLRYNGGGYLDIASEVGYMIAGPSRTQGKIFEKQIFNDKYPTINPITGEQLTALPFHSTSQGFSGPTNRALPHLDLGRVFLLTTDDTCSASESIINGLRGIDVQVIQVGSTTCGKPYGFYPTDNCGTTYFSIQLEGVNNKGEGDYSDGFSPANSTTQGTYALPGCSVADDFSHELGDSGEAMIAAALGYRLNQNCPAPTAKADESGARFSSAVISKPSVLMNRFVGRPHVGKILR